MDNLRALQLSDQTWVRSFLEKHWGAAQIVTCGRVHQAECLPGFVIEQAGCPVGLVTYCLADQACEVVSLDSVVQGQGIGTRLLAEVLSLARRQGCRRVWLITSNDNTPALRFYQKRGFRLVAIHREALTAARRLKPQIPWLGLDGIPICDEIELEINLT